MAMKFEKKGEGAFLLDVTGYVCPHPQLYTKKALEKMQTGNTLEIVFDNPSSGESIASMCDTTGTRSRRRRRAAGNTNGRSEKRNGRRDAALNFSPRGPIVKTTLWTVSHCCRMVELPYRIRRLLPHGDEGRPRRRRRRGRVWSRALRGIWGGRPIRRLRSAGGAFWRVWSPVAGPIRRVWSAVTSPFGRLRSPSGASCPSRRPGCALLHPFGGGG